MKEPPKVRRMHTGLCKKSACTEGGNLRQGQLSPCRAAAEPQQSGVRHDAMRLSDEELDAEGHLP